MTRLVVMVGGHSSGCRAVQQRWTAWATALRELGVDAAGPLHHGLGPAAWRRFADSEDDGSLAAACTRVGKSDAEIFLTGTDDLEDPMRDAAHVAHFESLAVDAGLELTVVTIVRDQIGAINHLYVDRVLQLATAKDFASFAAEPQPVERFDYGTAFDALRAAAVAEFVAVPFVDDPERQAREVLAALGVDRAALAALPAGKPAAPLAGPFTVAALRLLHKRFRRNGLMHKVPRRRLVEAARQIADDARLAGWDTTEFWGWSGAARGSAIGRFAAGNDDLARAVWDRDWGEDWADGEQTDPDLASSDPAVIAHIITTVDEAMREFRGSESGPGADESDPED